MRLEGTEQRVERQLASLGERVLEQVDRFGRFVLLIGVVVNNAILIVHQTTNFLEGRGESRYTTAEMTPRRAVAEAVRTRVRPIFMGMLTSVGGMLPLVLMPGAGSELYRGLGSVVIGGLAMSTVFTLFLVPSLFSLAMSARRRLVSAEKI